MQILVVYNKKNNRVIASFELNSVVTQMNCLITPGYGHIMSCKRDIFYKDSEGYVCVQLNSDCGFSEKMRFF